MADDDSDDKLKSTVRDTVLAVGASGVGLALGGPLGALAAPALLGATKVLWDEATDWRARRALLATNQLAAAPHDQRHAIAEGTRRALAGRRAQGRRYRQVAYDWLVSNTGDADRI